MTTDLLGLLAGTLTTISFIPQVWRIWRTRSARDISTPMYLTFTIGVALWLCYGIRIGSAPVIAANLITLLLAIVVLLLKRRFDRATRRR